MRNPIQYSSLDMSIVYCSDKRVSGVDGQESPNRMKRMNVKITRSGHPSAVVDETDGWIDEIMDRERLQDGISHLLQSNRRNELPDDL